MNWPIYRWLFLLCILIFVLKGASGFFVKHVQTGMCITDTDKKQSGGASWGALYFLELSNNCLDSTAQFRFLDNGAMFNSKRPGCIAAYYKAGIGHNLDMFYIYYSKNLDVSACAQNPDKNIYRPITQTSWGGLSVYFKGYRQSKFQTWCAVNGHHEKLAQNQEVDPYLKLTTPCNDAPNKRFHFGSVTCSGSLTNNTNCPKNQYMVVKTASYRGLSATKTCGLSDDYSCEVDVTCIVKKLCDGQHECNITVDDNLFPANSCQGFTRYLYFEYQCTNSRTRYAICVDEVSLSHSSLPNEGFVKIQTKYNGTQSVCWESLKNNADDVACRQMGYNRSVSLVAQAAPSDIKDEIFSGSISCTGEENYLSQCTVDDLTKGCSELSYINCFMCANPLLQDKEKFPDSSFTASASSEGHSASDGRISSGSSWCAPVSNDKHYLQVDLGRLYVIYNIVTFGDSSSSKWVTVYNVNYSVDLINWRSVLNYNISGNTKAMNQAAIQNFSGGKIIRALRFIPLSYVDQPCARIEICGATLVPDKPLNLTVTKRMSRSAEISWQDPQNSGDGNLTRFWIQLKKKNTSDLVHNITTGKVNKYQIDNLTPYTIYEISVAAGNKNGFGDEAQTSLTTMEEAPEGPPLNVQASVENSSSILVTWKEPEKDKRNGIIVSYTVCILHDESKPCFKEYTTVKKMLVIRNLNASTKYYVRVLASTKVGRGNYSKVTGKLITNGKPVSPVSKSYSSLSVNLVKQATYIKEVMIIVQIAPETPTAVKDIKTDVLKPYQNNSQDPYITAYFNTDNLPLTFVIGDGKEFDLKNKSYYNHPLEQNSSYIVFLRFFETKESYYSTQWSSSVKTMIKPPAPEVKVASTGLKNYTISWSVSPPSNQNVLKYYITSKLPNGSSEQFNVSNKITSHNIATEFNKKYTFEILVETNAGKSETTSKSWYSHSEPPKTPNKTKWGYKVVVKKPEEEQKIQTVDLIMLLQQPGSGKPPSPEQLDVQSSPPNDKEANNVAFIAETFSIENFTNGNLEVFLRGDDKRRERRDTRRVVTTGLIENAEYRTIQRNKDENDNYHWSYWSDSFVYTLPIYPTPSTTLEPVPSTSTILKPSSSPAITSKPRPAGDTGDEGSVGAAVGATIAVVVIVIVLVLSVIYLKRRGILQRYLRKESVDDLDEMEGIENDGNDGVNGNKTEGPLANDDIYSNQTGFVDEAEHAAVPVAEFAHYVNEMKAKDNYAFQSEYDKLPANMTTSWEVSKRSFNKQKNRYGNIVTYDHCRVVLSGDENEDYINASYIDGIKTNSYIASQGPTKRTVDDMWRMIWEQNTYSIVMVTSLVELGKPKCEKYWPDSGSKMYGDIEVTLMKTEEFADHVTHTLELRKDGEEREVRHYYFQSWPDHGVPKYPTQLLAFRRHFRTHHLEQSGPITVHCSAGVGRTGVFLAIDTILDKLEKGVINSIDVFGQVCAMRERRMNMVQTMEQYIFIHEAILETILCGMNEVDSSRIQVEVTNLAQVQANRMTGFQEKFKRLCEVSPKLSNEECIAGLLDENYNKNRNKNVYPAECSRVALQYVNGEENSDYINAVFVDGFLGRNYFIATQSPLPDTITDFWRLVHSQKSSTIVLLNNVKDGTSFPRFWPTRRGEPSHYGSMTVQLDSEGESSGIWTRKFIISPYPDLSDGHVVSMFHYTKWPDHRVPANGSGVITLTSLVEKSRQSHGEGPVIVACSDGAGRTGTYIAISNLLERMKIEQAMDVFQSIKIIRGTRPQFVENAEQYEFCYTAVMAYLDAFSEYANFE